MFKAIERPIKVIQFGEGGFLRGFVDWMLQKMNDAKVFCGNVAVVQPIEKGLCRMLEEQNGVYTHIIRGSEGVQSTECNVLSRFAYPYEDFEDYLSLADIESARFIVSNTTESGIVFDAADRPENAPHITFPAKLTLLLKRRFENGLGGFILLPCELIDRNGDNLKKCVLDYARLWGLGADFIEWIERENVFCNTLVDRINTGYPKGEDIALEYDDKMLNASEFFHLWVIESERDIEDELPFSKCGLNVIFTRDALERYRTRKVRVLNGAHTSMTPYALLCGFGTVKECMDDADMRAFVEGCVYEEILPTLELPADELQSYARDVFERFSNPYIKHYLSSIVLNSVSKFKVRVLPSLLTYIEKFGKTPSRLVFSLASLLDLYLSDMANDGEQVIEYLRTHTTYEILKNVDLWGEDISFLTDEVEAARGHRYVRINPKDNVKVDLKNGHKYAISLISTGEPVIKYGECIGFATTNIAIGEHVHVHNLRTSLTEKVEYSYDGCVAKGFEAAQDERTFMGYERADGSVGIRNEIWIIPTVGCVNEIARRISALTGAHAFVHPFGCSQLGEDHERTQLILRGLINHPNAAGVLVLGLGCENNGIAAMKKILGNYDAERVRFLNCQDVCDEVTEACGIIDELKQYVAAFERKPIPAAKLTIGLKCGGSDGYSGITANPLVGRFADAHISGGGSCILTEVPEMFGAEHLLMRRCINAEVFEKTVSLINDFKDYYVRHGQTVYENPSPGNKEGGISTLEEKSLGCIQKGGSSPVVDVIGYGDTVRRNGLSLLDGPGNDIVAVTNLAAAGAHMILFTTGRGTPLGSAVPTVKISTNSALAEKKSSWIDFDAGKALDDPALENALMDYVLRVASGEETQNERFGFREISIFKDGVTL